MGKGEISKNSVGRTSRYDILYRRSPAWLVPDGSSLPYPGDWAGFVVSVCPAGHTWRPGDTADPKRNLVELELNDEQLAAIRSGKLRLAEDGRSLVPVDFDDRWGRLAEVLRANFADPEKAEREQDDEKSLDGQRFGELAALNMRMLPKTVTHSGAGLYEVGPGKTYSTIQSALDQLWTDQGSAVFTASQYIRIFAGTYDETPTVNSALNPNEPAGYLLIIEGDPTDSRDNIVIAPSGAPSVGLHVDCDHALVRHLKVAGNPVNYGIYSWSNSVALDVHDCVIDNSAFRGIAGKYGAVAVIDCDISTGSIYGVTTKGECMVLRTKLKGTGGWAVYAGRSLHVEGVTVTGFGSGFFIGDMYSTTHGTVKHCTLYDLTYGVVVPGSCGMLSRIVAQNNIFKDVTYPWKCTIWPQGLGDELVVRNNCYHGYTAFAYGAGAATKTFAEFTALAGVDSSGELDATDPLLTDPASEDFSLEADSPCRHTGHGSGVVSDYLGTVCDPHHPDIGAWSSGQVQAPERPSVEIISVAGDTITVGVDGDAAVENRAELVRARTGEVVDTALRDGDGEVSLTAPELSVRYFVVASSRNAAGRSLSSEPREVIVSEGEGPFEEVRIGVVSRLKAHAGLAALLGTDETGAVPVYAASPAKQRRVPCLVYTLGGLPDRMLSTPGRWNVTVTFEAWGGSPGVNDRIVGFTAEVLDRRPFQGTSWTVKRCQCTSDETRWTDDGRTEIRRTAWALVVDRGGA